MRVLLCLLALIGPILPTPVPLMTIEGFTVQHVPQKPGSVAPARTYVNWRGTGGQWCLVSPRESICQRWRDGLNKTTIDARPGNIIELRDGETVLARACGAAAVYPAGAAASSAILTSALRRAGRAYSGNRAHAVFIEWLAQKRDCGRPELLRQLGAFSQADRETRRDPPPSIRIGRRLQASCQQVDFHIKIGDPQFNLIHADTT
jgi:hypothetical protein